MLTRVFLSIALLVAMSAWSQVSTTDGGIGLAMTDQMLTPPPVNDEAYPTAVGSEVRRNYLRAGLTVTTAYSDNVLGGDAVTPVSDVDYAIFPTIAIDKSTSRLYLRSTYSPGFTIYQHTSARNQTDQYAALNFLYRLTPHVTVVLQDSLQKTSNFFNQPYPFSGEGVSGSPQPPLYAIISPVAGQLGNDANTELRYQFSRNGMIGASGIFTTLHYTHPTEVLGIYNSSSSGGSAFYSHRLSRMHYVGATYRYSRILAYPPNAQSEIQAHTIFLFYTIYLKPTFSLSFSGGPQHYRRRSVPPAGLRLMVPYFNGEYELARASY